MCLVGAIFHRERDVRFYSVVVAVVGRMAAWSTVRAIFVVERCTVVDGAVWLKLWADIINSVVAIDIIGSGYIVPHCISDDSSSSSSGGSLVDHILWHFKPDLCVAGRCVNEVNETFRWDSLHHAALFIQRLLCSIESRVGCGD